MGSPGTDGVHWWSVWGRVALQRVNPYGAQRRDAPLAPWFPGDDELDGGDSPGLWGGGSTSEHALVLSQKAPEGEEGELWLYLSEFTGLDDDTELLDAMVLRVAEP